MKIIINVAPVNEAGLLAQTSAGSIAESLKESLTAVGWPITSIEVIPSPATPVPLDVLFTSDSEKSCNAWIQKNCPGQSYPRTCKTCKLGPCQFQANLSKQ